MLSKTFFYFNPSMGGAMQNCRLQEHSSLVRFVSAAAFVWASLAAFCR